MIPRTKILIVSVAAMSCLAALACERSVKGATPATKAAEVKETRTSSDTVEPSNTDGLLTIITDRTQYQRNQHVIVTVENGTDHVLYDDHCAGALRWFGMSAKWIASDGFRACGVFSTAPPPGWKPPSWRERSVAIPPLAVHVDSFLVGQSAYPGTWRVELWLRNERGELLREDQRISNYFKIALPPE